MPPRIFIRVDLPAPFSPTSATISPGSASSETLLSATTPGNRLLIPFISSNGVVVRFIQDFGKKALPRQSLFPHIIRFDLAAPSQLVDLDDEVIDAVFFDRQRRNNIQFVR